MDETKCCWWAQQQVIEIPVEMEFHNYVNKVIALVRPKDIMVYAQGSNHEQDYITNIIGSDLIWR